MRGDRNTKAEHLVAVGKSSFVKGSTGSAVIPTSYRLCFFYKLG